MAATQEEIDKTNAATQAHIDVVRLLMFEIVAELSKRALHHDAGKMRSPEVEVFAEMTPKLAGSTFGSEEYKGYLKYMSKALDHHYAFNRHHPQYFSDGISGMNLVDIVEMFVDWCAASKRHNDGNISKSVDINQKRFGIPRELCDIFKNTIELLEG